MIKIALIGAGAIAQQVYLPFFRNNHAATLTAIAERDPKIVADLTENRPLPYIGPDIDTAIQDVDAVIICLPNDLHYPVAQKCLTAGKHVLCEKPLCISSADGNDLYEIAQAKSLILSVAQVRRFYPAAKWIKGAIDDQKLGALKSFDFREGAVFNWSTVTGYIFDREKAGGGVLMDIGAHLLDLLFWWINDDIASFHYADDNLGGVEATAQISMTFKSGIQGKIKLTRLSVLQNFYTLYFEKGTVSWNPLAAQRLYIQNDQGKTTVKTLGKGKPVDEMLRDFFSSVQHRHFPLVKREEALRTIRFIEGCYRSPEAIPMPWLH